MRMQEDQRLPALAVLDDRPGSGAEGDRDSETVQLVTTLAAMPTKEEVVEALRQVEDPELGMDIVELGLMYDVEVEGPKVHITYTLTSMGCPVGPMIEEQIQEFAAQVPGVEQVEAELTWSPPWSPEKMSDDAKFILGFG
jgi:metal-sulfur cluster biosynthetic enzyme